MIITSILEFLHVLTAVGWLGGGILFAFLIGPRLGKLSPSTSREFVVTVVPGVVRFFQIVAGLTVLFGILLLLNMVNGDFSQLSPSTTWGLAITLGISVAVVAFILFEFVTVPAFNRLVRLNRGFSSDADHPPSDLPMAARRAGMLGIVTTLLLLVVLVFMVAAGFY